jgi:phospholipase C
MNRIEHLILVMMENRSFDHYLGSLSLLEGRQDVEGLPNPLPTIPDNQQNPVAPWSMDGNFSGYADPPHGWSWQHANYDNGNNDGFVQQYQAAYPNGQSNDKPPLPAPANLPMGYYTRETLPVLYALADRFTLCDHWFSSVLSSTWPNRKYFHSGQMDDDNDTQTLPPFPGFKTTPLYNVLEDTVDPATGNKYTWKCYFSDLPFLAFWYKFAAFHALGHFTSIDSFALDCREDRLPTVSVIDPPFSLADDHPSHDVRLGQKLLGLIVDALTNSESWQKSALVLLYDENGGFYDHVVPPSSFKDGDPPLGEPLGFRVPALVISAYPLRDGERGKVCQTVFDHTSIMKSIHTRWNVPFDPAVFGTRWQSAPDIWTDCFDFSQDPLPMGTYTGQEPQLQALNWGTGIQDLLISPANILEGFLDRIFLLPALKTLDRRAQVFQNLSALEDHVIELKRMI